MSGYAAELENELELEQELELENEGESQELEHEMEGEHEAFFNHLAAMGDRGGRSQALRRIALAAAKQALKSAPSASRVIEGESEFEFEAEGEMELESTPTQRAHYAGMMEHMGHAAAEAANEQEAAEHFLPLIGLAAKFVAPKLLGFAAKKIGGKLLGKAGGQLIKKVGGNAVKRVASRALGRVAPRLTKGVANVARTLYRNKSTRPLLHAVPRIARGTMKTLVRRAAQGGRVTAQVAARALASNTARTLANPRVLAQTYRRSLVQDRRYHRHTRRVLGRPAGTPVRAAVPGTPSYGSAIPPQFVGALGTIGGSVPTSGGCNCRCSCQPAGANGSIPGLAMETATCPTCGR